MFLCTYLQHLTGEPPKDFSEMACDSCMKSHDFLSVYQLRTQPIKMLKEDTGASVTVTDSPGNNEAVPTSKHNPEDMQKQENQVDKNRTDDNSCELARRQLLLGSCGSGNRKERGAGFFEENWRAQLCLCQSCKVRL